MVSANNKLTNPGSAVQSPDLNWSQVKETISLMCLAMAQIDTTLTDSSRSVDDLTESFTFLAKDAMKLCEIHEKDSSGEGADSPLLSQTQEIAVSMLQRINSAIIAFQFYDRLTQRLHHVRGTLNDLGELIDDPTQLYNPEEWSKLQNEIRSCYTMECERLMFDRIMKGDTIDEALQLYHHQFTEEDKIKDSDDQTDDDIELF
ncbi:MAG: hypothetical protein JKY67_12500 [Pseudomonadales bacterium]|nr:hypothetical protein [Pseudomonadales bacterium]